MWTLHYGFTLVAVVEGVWEEWMWISCNNCLWFTQMNQLDATISPVYYLTFVYSSTCLGRPHAHHQELNNFSSSLWFYLRTVGIAVLLVVVGPTTTNSTAITTHLVSWFIWIVLLSLFIINNYISNKGMLDEWVKAASVEVTGTATTSFIH